jgi:uncharacterized membrane protein (UPF0127 family)
MRFPIDVVFLDRKLRVLRLGPDLAPWKATGSRGQQRLTSRQSAMLRVVSLGRSAETHKGRVDRPMRGTCGGETTPPEMF